MYFVIIMDNNNTSKNHEHELVNEELNAEHTVIGPECGAE